MCILAGLPSFYLNLWLSEVKSLTKNENTSMSFQMNILTSKVVS